MKGRSRSLSMKYFRGAENTLEQYDRRRHKGNRIYVMNLIVALPSR